MLGKTAFLTRVTAHDHTRMTGLMIDESYEFLIIKRRRLSSSTQRLGLFYEDHRDSGRHFTLRYSGRADWLALIRAAQEVQAGEFSDFGAQRPATHWCCRPTVAETRSTMMMRRLSFVRGSLIFGGIEGHILWNSSGIPGGPAHEAGTPGGKKV